MRVLANYVLGAWRTPPGDGEVLADAVTGEPVAAISSAGIDLGEVLAYGRTVGGPALRALSFHERALLLKQMGAALMAVKEDLYERSYPTGATRQDAWIDIEGGIGTLFAYSSIGRRELPNRHVLLDGAPIALAKDGSFLAQHLQVPLEGVGVHVNAFNFPVWGLLEKLAPAFLAGVPVVSKPAPQTAYLAHRAVEHLVASGLLPDGSLQLVTGQPRDLLDHVTSQDLVAVTGSASTTQRLRAHPAIVASATRYVAEADSLNAAVLGPDAGIGSAELDLFVREVAREITVKAGQKCTAIRRALVPRDLLEPVAEAITARLSGVVVGDPREESTRMGALVDRLQVERFEAAVGSIAAGGEVRAASLPAGLKRGAFVAPRLVLADPEADAPHEVEAFGPAASLLAYDDLDEAVALMKRGRGSLVASLFTADRDVARTVAVGAASHHGRLLVVDASCGRTSTGHGSPMPGLVHGGPGRAGGSEELGGLRSVGHYLQRVAVQGSPDLVGAIADAYLPGGTRDTSHGHPFRRTFDDLAVGEAIVTDEREITVADIEAFAELTGDRFYAHLDEEAAKASPIFQGRVAHGYLVLSAAAGLFVWPDPGPVLANYGLDNLRFVTPVYPGDRIRVALTCKDKSLRIGAGYGEVRWDAQVTNQDGAVVAAYDLLTMVATRA